MVSTKRKKKKKKKPPVYLQHRIPVISSQAIWRPSSVLECPESPEVFPKLLSCPLMIAQLVVVPALRTECLSSAVSGNCLGSELFTCGTTAHIGYFHRCIVHSVIYLITHTHQHTHIYIYIYIYHLRSLKFTLKHLKRSYMFRSHDHLQGAYSVPC